MGEIIAMFDNYSIHKCSYFNSNTNEYVIYYLCKPTYDVSVYNLFIGFPNKELEGLSNDEMVAEINNVANVITSSYGGVYLLPVISYAKLVEAAVENDYKTDKYGVINDKHGMYGDIFWNIITPITTQVYEDFDRKFNNKRYMIKRDNCDRLLINWISTICNNYGENLIGEIEYSDLMKHYTQGKKADNLIIENFPTSLDNDGSGIAPVNHDLDNSNDMKKSFARRYVKPKNVSPGFSNIKFLIAILLMSLVVGISVAYLLMK